MSLSSKQQQQLVTTLFLLATVVLLIFTHFYVLMVNPPTSVGEEHLIEVNSGMGISEVAQLLYANGIIKRKGLFMVLARLSGAAPKIKAGEYRFSSAMSPWAILNSLRQGWAVLHRITIPEGYSMYQIAQLLEEKGIISGEEFLAAASDKSLLAAFGIPANNMEGYLFPETYYFKKREPATSIIKIMVNQFQRVFTSTMEAEAEELGFTRHQLVTLASLIEKEVAVPEERRLISAVYHNRLQRGMLLQCDPTVIYACEDFNGNLTKKDLKIDSPYNTYRYRGLPPGPIANPGKESLEAALRPSQVNYTYFVSKNDGTHHFSSNLRKHNRAVYKYQKKRSSRSLNSRRK